MRPFKYEALPPGPGSIRLLKLLPSECADAPIKCCLVNYSLLNRRQTSHRYEALSYCWGSLNNKVDIAINSNVLQVTQNLYAALRRFRDPDFERIMWIDAICINQDDLDERANQVQIMASIYACADKVVVWLGEAADGSGEAFKEIRAAAEHGSIRMKYVQGSENDGVNTIRHQQSDESSDDNLDELFHYQVVNGKEAQRKKEEKKIQASFRVRKLLERQWFRRVWVLQEIAAARLLLVTCGPDEISGHFIQRGLQSMDLSKGDLAPLARQLPGVMFIMNSINSFAQDAAKQDISARLNVLPLPSLLDMLHAHEATDKRDKIYALLGISSQRISIIPDYRKDWQTLFHDTIKEILGPKVTIRTWPGQDIILIRANMRVIARVTDIRIKNNWEQSLKCDSAGHKPTFRKLGNIVQETYLHWKASFRFPRLAERVQETDLICFLEGHNLPCLVRPHEDHLLIIAVALPPPKEIMYQKFGSHRVHLPWSKLRDTISGYRNNILLVWNWSEKESSIPNSIDSARSDLEMLQSLATEVQEELVSADDLFSILALVDLVTPPRRAEISSYHRRLLGEKQQLQDYEISVAIQAHIFKFFHHSHYQALKGRVLPQLETNGQSFHSYHVEDQKDSEIISIEAFKATGSLEISVLEFLSLLQQDLHVTQRAICTLLDDSGSQRDIYDSSEQFNLALILLGSLLPVQFSVEVLFECFFLKAPKANDNCHGLPGYHYLTNLCDSAIACNLRDWSIEVLNELFRQGLVYGKIRRDLLAAILHCPVPQREAVLERNSDAIRKDLKDPDFYQQMPLLLELETEDDTKCMSIYCERFQTEGLRRWLRLSVLGCRKLDRYIGTKDEEIAQEILKHGVEPFFELGLGGKLLWNACHRHRVRTVKALLATGQVDPTSQDVSGRDVLFHAVRCYGNNPIVKALLDSAFTFSVESLEAALQEALDRTKDPETIRRITSALEVARLEESNQKAMMNNQVDSTGGIERE